MADHIKINTGMLRDMGSQLGRLRDEFDNSTNITNAAAGELGSGDVAGALNNFASDWSTKRDQLTKGLDTLSTTATQAAEHWDGLDSDLAKAIANAFQPQPQTQQQPPTQPPTQPHAPARGAK